LIGVYPIPFVIMAAGVGVGAVVEGREVKDVLIGLPSKDINSHPVPLIVLLLVEMVIGKRVEEGGFRDGV